ncbi:class I SAM-dependent methyltransferase [Acuticoccus mangrovi]|uniref:Class I SAM-dependent methyltransferase n=1 Tax=Acuticoccus mangrovi TaxID=2796142 RepID=A0A934IP60_9HYPH|nr:class I SAM-dependent methyltransferase [Acuticoccus mangrovi]
MNDVLIRRSIEDSADFIEPYLAHSLLIRRTTQIRDFAIRRVPPDGIVMELGVYQGAGINQFADVLAARGDSRTLYGFDAFKGLSEDWFGKSIAARANFDRKGRPPKVRPNVELVVGWVEETLAPFLAAHPGPVAFVHLDTDTYTPARLALELLKPRFAAGSIVLFDEHHGYPNWRNGEYRALTEVFEPDDYQYTAFASQQAVIRMRG